MATGSPRWSSSPRSAGSPGRRSITTSHSKEALFRAVSEAVLEGALEAERSAALREERAGKGLAEIMAAQLGARYRHFFDLLRGSAHAEELMSEHQRQTRDLRQRFAQQKSDMIAETIARVAPRMGSSCGTALTPAELARCVGSSRAASVSKRRMKAASPISNDPFACSFAGRSPRRPSRTSPKPERARR